MNLISSSARGAAWPGRPLRIVGVDPERGFAGGESQVLGLTLELLRLGHHAELLCDPDGLLWRRAQAANVGCHPLRIRNALDCLAGLRLRRFLANYPYDVVHFHTSRAHAIAPFAAGLAGALVVTRRMDYVPNRWFAPWFYNRAVDAVAAISEDVARALSSAGVSRQRLTIIPSGVDCLHFVPPTAGQRAAARQLLGLEPGELVVGAAGSLELRKGHRYLLQALAEMRDRREPIRCLIAGEGSQRAALEEQVRGLGLESTVRLLGSIPDPLALFWAIDIFVQPSLKEGLGVALLEAMACGLPSIASRRGGMTEVIEDGRSGMLVEASDEHEIAQAIGGLIDSPAARVSIGAAARTRIERNFSLQAMASKTLTLYQSSLAGRLGRCAA